MLQALERRRAASRRRALRRAVSIECEILSDLWDSSVPHLTTDLSPLGLWAETQFPLEAGDEVIVTLTPPSWPSTSPLVALASVARVGMFRRRTDVRAPGMGLAFIDLEKSEVQALTHGLRGIPPPLPSQLRRPVTVPEAYGSINRAAGQAPALIAARGGPEIHFRAEAALLTGARRRDIGVSAPPAALPVPRRFAASARGPAKSIPYLRAVA